MSSTASSKSSKSKAEKPGKEKPAKPEKKDEKTKDEHEHHHHHHHHKPYEEIGVLFNGNELKIRIPKVTSKPPKTAQSQMAMQCKCENVSACTDLCGFPGIEGAKPLSGKPSEAMCGVCDVTPSDAPKGVHAEKVINSDKDVFLVKIGKETGEPNRTGSIEVELITPRAPGKVPAAVYATKKIQIEEEDFPCCLTCLPPKPRKRKGRPPPCCR